MRDGKVVAADAAAFDRDKLVTAMGGAEHGPAGRSGAAHNRARRRAGPRSRPSGEADRRRRARRPRRRDHRPRRARRPRPDRPAARDLRGRQPQDAHDRGHRAGRAGRRRPPGRRHLSAVVDRREHRHPLDRRAPPRPSHLAGARGRACRGLAEEDQHPHARHPQQHPVALRRQPAEGAVRPRARLGRPRSS